MSKQGRMDLIRRYYVSFNHILVPLRAGLKIKAKKLVWTTIVKVRVRKRIMIMIMIWTIFLEKGN